ncbi:hypothetical protein Tco_1030923 [Tanacetum coccineum]|uniref:Uncharacterized protein n=1 Tax=Tanacetum coccineum TaxID=301880 RepID=A0ABQ5G9F4_9ASTR
MSASNNSNNSYQQTLAESGANARPPMLEKGNYIPWESRFRNFLENQLEEGERMWHSIQHGPYQRPMVPSSLRYVMEIFGPEYLRKPTITDIEKLYVFHEEKHRREHGPNPFILLEAVAS